MWNVTKLTADAAKNMQVNAGLLLKNFNVADPAEPSAEDIVCDTTGDYSISCVPDTKDFFEDVNNAPKNTKEGKRITGWNCSLGVTALSVTHETLRLSLGASKEGGVGNEGIIPKTQFEETDFKSLYWIGDMGDSDKLFAVVMDNTVSTGGISFSATDNGKGRLALTLMPHSSIENPDVVPMAFYILEKRES